MIENDFSRVVRRYLAAVAGATRRCAGLLAALEDELGPDARASTATDDAGRSETEDSDDEAAARGGGGDDPRALPEGVPELRAAFDELLDSLGAAYVRRADTPQTGRGDAAATTWIFRGDGSRRRRGYDVDIPWR